MFLTVKLTHISDNLFFVTLIELKVEKLKVESNLIEYL
jgi:hypothetical protein